MSIEIQTEPLIVFAVPPERLGMKLTADAAGARLAAGVLCHGFGPPAIDRRPVLGIPEGPYLERASEVGLEHFHATCDRLADAGYTIRPVGAFADFALKAQAEKEKAERAKKAAEEKSKA